MGCAHARHAPALDVDADDLALLDWLRRRIWPFEAAHDERSLRASADLGIAELLKGGTTAILDMGTVNHHDAVFTAIDGPCSPRT